MKAPKIRFKGFEGAWEEFSLGGLLSEFDERSDINDQDNLLSSTKKWLFYNREYFSWLKQQNTKWYKKIFKNYLVFSPQNLWLWNINVNDSFEYWLLSPSYKIYSFKSNLLPTFFKQIQKTEKMINQYILSSEMWASIVRRNLNLSLFYKIPISLPSLPEQEKIWAFFEQLDSQITKNQQKLEKLKNMKKSFLQKLFPKAWATVPELRFKGFEGAWEERELGESATITTWWTPSTTIEKYRYPKEISWLSSWEVNKKHIYFTDNKISQEWLSNSSTKLINKKSVLIALAWQWKTRWTVAINHIPLTTNQSIAAIILQTNINTEYTFSNLESRYEEIRKYSSWDWTRWWLNKQIISEIKIPYTSLPEQEKIWAFFEKLDTQITHQSQKIQKLQNIKQSLLEKMFI